MNAYSIMYITAVIFKEELNAVELTLPKYDILEIVKLQSKKI